MKLNWNFQKGEKIIKETPSMGGKGYFLVETTECKTYEHFTVVTESPPEKNVLLWFLL